MFMKEPCLSLLRGCQPVLLQARTPRLEGIFHEFWCTANIYTEQGPQFGSTTNISIDVYLQRCTQLMTSIVCL